MSATGGQAAQKETGNNGEVVDGAVGERIEGEGEKEKPPLGGEGGGSAVGGEDGNASTTGEKEPEKEEPTGSNQSERAGREQEQAAVTSADDAAATFDSESEESSEEEEETQEELLVELADAVADAEETLDHEALAQKLKDLKLRGEWMNERMLHCCSRPDTHAGCSLLSQSRSTFAQTQNLSPTPPHPTPPSVSSVVYRPRAVDKNVP